MVTPIKGIAIEDISVIRGTVKARNVYIFLFLVNGQF